jgi:hypothetical protein
MEGMWMIVYLGSIQKFEQVKKENIVQNLNFDINSMGFWFTSDIHSAKTFARGTETVFQKSDTEFWEDGEPKVVQMEKPVNGFIYKVYMDDPSLKEYESDSEDSFDLFMRERDKYCDYLGGNKRNLTWKDHAILLNKEEANEKFRHHLIRQGFEGCFIRNTKQLQNEVTNLICIFSEDSLHIADFIPVDDLE